MKNIQPDMNVAKQFRKANVQMDAAMQAGQPEKASYIADLISMMSESIDKGELRPWSEFSPMIDEEFD